MDLQLDSGSDLSINNQHTWKRLKKKKNNEEINSSNWWQKEVRRWTNTTRNTKQSENLFGTDWMERFLLQDRKPNYRGTRIKRWTKSNISSSWFRRDSGKCTKAIARFELKENALPVFKKKRNVRFAALEQIDVVLDRLEKAGILSKVSSSEWAAPTVYVRKKSNQICVCADFSTGLYAALKDYHYPLPTPE